MELKRCFDLLQLDPNATLEEAKYAYKTQVKYYHPDCFVGDDLQKQKAEEKLKEINLAYEKIRSLLRFKQEKAAKTPDQPNFHVGAGTIFNARPEHTSFFSWLISKVRQFDLSFFFQIRDGSTRVSEKNSPSYRQKNVNFKDILREAEKRHVKGGRRPVNAEINNPERRRKGHRKRQTMWQQCGCRRRLNNDGTGPVRAVRPVGRVRGIGR